MKIVGAALAGYFIYKHFKAKKAGRNASGADPQIFPGSDEIYVTPGDYQMTCVIPSGDAAAPVSIGESAVISIGPGDSVTISDVPPSVAATALAPTTTVPEAAVSNDIPTSNDGLKTAHDRYISSYRTYTTLATNSGGADPAEVQRALAEYRTAYNDYQNIKAAAGSK